MFAVVIIDGDDRAVEGVYAFTTEELAKEAVSAWEKADHEELEAEGDFREPVWAGDFVTDTYAGVVYQLVDGVTVDGK